MNFFLFLLSAICVIQLSHGGITEEAADQETYSRFEEFLTRYSKSYPDHELDYRYRIFRANLKKIETLNKYEQGDAVYGVTQFADLTKIEFEEKYLGFNYNPDRHNKSALDDGPSSKKEIPLPSIPTEYDWRSFNVVTPVKNQGMCGSCWAFSVTGNVEGQYAIKYGKLLSFSEQELVDCDKTDHGCEGGYMTDGYSFIETLGGLETEADYPYEGSDETCRFVKNKVKVAVTNYVNISSDENVMAEWLFKNGPISIAINANAMQFYFGGVSHPFKFLCSPNNLNHGVLLVGYGLHKTKFTKKIVPYWLIKNSWGTSWGEHGYYRLYRGSGVCGVNKMPTSAIIQ